MLPGLPTLPRFRRSWINGGRVARDGEERGKSERNGEAKKKKKG